MELPVLGGSYGRPEPSAMTICPRILPTGALRARRARSARAPDVSAWARYRHTALDRGAGRDAIEPAPDVAELRDLVGHHVLERLPRGDDPGVGRDVGDRILSGQIVASLEGGVQNADDAERLADEALDGVRDLLGRLV